MLLVLPMGLGGWIGAKAALAALAGVLAALTVWTARHRFGISPRVAYTTAALFSLAPPLAIYATQVYPALPAALSLLTGLAALLGPFQRRGRAVFALTVIALPWLAVKYVPVAAVLAVGGLVKAGRGRRSGLLAVFVTAGVLYVVAHFVIYGGPTAYAAGDHFVGGQLTVVGTDVDLWGRSTRLVGLLVDRGFGIAAWQPAFFLLPLVAGWSIAKRGPGFSLAVSLLGVGWLVAAFVALTMHGWWFPGRQLVVVLPVWVLLVAGWADCSRRRLRWLVVAGGAGVTAFAFLAVEGLMGRLTWVVDFGSTANPVYRAVSSLLPDYMLPTTGTWVLHGLWVVVALALGWLGWRSGSSRDEQPQTNQATDERISTWPSAAPGSY